MSKNKTPIQNENKITSGRGAGRLGRAEEASATGQRGRCRRSRRGGGGTWKTFFSSSQ